jgi:hypothetical protein
VAHILPTGLVTGYDATAGGYELPSLRVLISSLTRCIRTPLHVNISTTDTSVRTDFNTTFGTF